MRLDELKELGWRITTLQRTFVNSCNNSDQTIWWNEEPTRAIILATNAKTDHRIKKYRER